MTQIAAVGVVGRTVKLCLHFQAQRSTRADIAEDMRRFVHRLGLTTRELGWLPHEQFREYVREHIDLALQVSATESFNYVALDHTSQGIPVVGSPAITHLPPEWQANPDDPTDIAACLQRVIAEYSRACEKAVGAARKIINDNNRCIIETAQRFLA